MFRFRDKYTMDQLRRKVFSYEGNFRNFQDIDETKYAELKKNIEEFIARQSNVFGKGSNLDKYIELLGYMSHKVEYNHAPYDEKIIMLIEAVDPEFIHFKKYLTTERGEEFNRNLAQAVRKELSFYDPKLIGYESILFNKFRKQKEFIHGIKEDDTEIFYKYLAHTNGLDGVTPEAREKVTEIVNKWLENMTEDDSYLTAFYHVTFQGKALGLTNFREKAIFLIETVDPELKMLDTYYNTNRKEDCIEESTERVGFYSDDFVRLEKMYAKVYNPELAEDPWGVKKNTR